jgi:dimethylamine monooxygenase subunit A
VIPLPPAAKYTPYDKGIYQVGPLLRPFGTDFGNGPEIENKTFLIDSNYPEYRQTKELSLKEDRNKYSGEARLEEALKTQAVHFIIDKLCRDYPKIFSYQNKGDSKELDCQHSGDRLVFSKEGHLLESTCQAHDSLEALSLQIQEDFSIWNYQELATGELRDWMAYGSICYPNHWAPQEKIGQNFIAVHQPVAGSDPMLKTSAQIVRLMVNKGPFVRFAWGVSTDTRLNHHPEPAPNADALEWRGRSFDPQNPQLWVRYERQTLHGFPELNMAFFTIRTYFEDVHEIKKSPFYCEALKKALLSMTPESLLYKGLSESLDSIVNWLDAK